MNGWDDQWEAARRAVDPEAALTPVRIAIEHRGAYHALGDELQLAWVELTGKAFHAALDKRALPTVGDWVLVEHWARARADKGAAVIRHVLPRRTFLVRRAAGEATLPQPLAANVDVGVVMTSANSDLVAARLDRYIGLLREGGIEPVIAVSKVDLVGDPEPALAIVRATGVTAIAVSAITGHGLDNIRALGGAGKTALVLGSSGVGKSTLLNALIGAAQLTREIRDDQRGVHTTTRRELLIAPDGGAWIDTPGMRELAQWIDDDEEVAFDDIDALAENCRFRDCAHRDEPGCAVRGVVTADRLASFHKLGAERKKGEIDQKQARRLAQTRRAPKKAPPRE